MNIRKLSEEMINRIAAGEVIERPASVVKELVENALDAGASRIEIATAGGGLNLIRVSDDGCGMAPDELELALARHCTSKLHDTIDDIRSLGFRGEALPSIGSVARLTLRSRRAGDPHATAIEVAGGSMSPVRPVAANRGTVVEVRDLFFSTPARLKFMKSERAETAAITECVRRIAIAFPQVHFLLTGSDRQSLELEAGEPLARLAQILGREFTGNCVAIDAVREEVRLSGHVSIPAFNRGNALAQYVHVNGRPVRDRMIAAALRAAYADLLPRDRHGTAALAITIDPSLVDVNVHPAKADVRFRDPGLVRGLIIGAIRQALEGGGLRSSRRAAVAMADAFRPAATAAAMPPRGFAEEGQALFAAGSMASAASPAEPAPPPADAPLGAACAQIHDNYIIAQTSDSLVIVDQHAAHERLVYEALKSTLSAAPLAAQMLLIPEIVDLPEEDVGRLMEEAETLERFGLLIERFGPGAVCVRATPAMLGETDAAALMRELADELADDRAGGLGQRLDAVASTMACHGSVRSGRRLKPPEMNALLRQMERNPQAGTCNHGRPTFIELKLTDIERLFQRR